MGRLLLPEGVKLFGANIVPKAADITPDPQSAWIEMFSNWDWAGWVKPQIDYLAGNAVGANCIRLVGSQEGVVTDAFSQSDHDDKYEQFVSYCKSLGVYVFACTGGTQQPLVTAVGSGLTAAQLASVQASTIRRIQGYGNVVGVDLIQESQTFSIGHTFLAQNVRAVREVGVKLPLTFSASAINTAFQTPVVGIGHTAQNFYLNPSFGPLGAEVDFFSVHTYFRDYDASWFNQFFAAYPDHDILIGEFGRAFSDGPTNPSTSVTRALQTADYEKWFAMGAAPDRRVRGAICWAATDQKDPTVQADDAWGVYSADFVPRHWMLDVMKKYTGGSVHRANNRRW